MGSGTSSSPHLGGCVSQISVPMSRYLNQSTYKEEWCILAYSFGDFSSCLFGPIAFG
jgi:hypothetical protein